MVGTDWAALLATGSRWLQLRRYLWAAARREHKRDRDGLLWRVRSHKWARFPRGRPNTCSAREFGTILQDDCLRRVRVYWVRIIPCAGAGARVP